MKDFATLFLALDQTTSADATVAALADFFESASPSDRLWTIALFSGRRPKRAVTMTRLREWSAELAGIPLWLFEKTYSIVGDLAETIALILPDPTNRADPSLTEQINEIRSLASLSEDEKKVRIVSAWNKFETAERFVLNKLITGSFRIGISQKLMARALSRATGIEETELAYRLMGDWSPETTSYEQLILAPDPQSALSKPYPFCLAFQMDGAVEALGVPGDWAAEHKWDGIRGQVVLRGGAHFTWSRGEELMTDRFPELAVLVDFMPPGTVLDGELLAWDYGTDTPQSFNALKKRIGRKTVPKKLLAEAPVVLRAYDLLECNGEDIRAKPFAERRALLNALFASLPKTVPLRLSPLLGFKTWDALAKHRAISRDIGAEGVMLKRLDSPYREARHKGDWWKWKLDPLTIDAVMIYAQAGQGQQTTLFTDFTFAVWNGNDLVPLTKAHSGLTDAEFSEITAWIRKNTIERFGPVRSVKAAHVFEIAFEGIQQSTRHKSGLTLRTPSMLRWRKDKPVAEANTLSDLKAMLATYG